LNILSGVSETGKEFAVTQKVESLEGTTGFKIIKAIDISHMSTLSYESVEWHVYAICLWKNNPTYQTHHCWSKGGTEQQTDEPSLIG